MLLSQLGPLNKPLTLFQKKIALLPADPAGIAQTHSTAA
jgi:hypothetical protein